MFSKYVMLVFYFSALLTDGQLLGWKKALLERHNKKRSMVAQGRPGLGIPHAAYMPKLYWNTTLEYEADQIMCQNIRNSSLNHIYTQTKSYQEALFIVDQFYTGYMSMTLAQRKANKYTISLSKKPDPPHYINLVWGATISIGCGWKRCPHPPDRLYPYQLICIYSPHSVPDGRQIYIIGAPCSQCHGFFCDPSIGLCDLSRPITMSSAVTSVLSSETSSMESTTSSVSSMTSSVSSMTSSVSSMTSHISTSTPITASIATSIWTNSTRQTTSVTETSKQLNSTLTNGYTSIMATTAFPLWAIFVIIGGVVLLVIVAIVILLVMRRRKKNKLMKDKPKPPKALQLQESQIQMPTGDQAVDTTTKTGEKGYENVTKHPLITEESKPQASGPYENM